MDMFIDVGMSHTNLVAWKDKGKGRGATGYGYVMYARDSQSGAQSSAVDGRAVDPTEMTLATISGMHLSCRFTIVLLTRSIAWFKVAEAVGRER